MIRHPRVLLMPSPVSSGSVGTTLKAIGLAHLLKKRGCQVRFVMGGELGAFVSRQGFAVAACPTPEYVGNTQSIHNIVNFIQWTGLADADFVEQAVEAEIAAIREFHPDVIFAEARPSAAISAAATGVPLVTVASWPMHPDFPENRLAINQPLEAFNRQLQRYGLAEIQHVAELLFLRSTLKISPSLPELEPELQAVPEIRFVGHMLDRTVDETQLPPWYHSWRTAPLILVYLSVGAITPELYLRTLPEAFQDLPFNVLCACGFHFAVGADDLAKFRGNVRFVRFVPMQAVIGEASLVIFHGGQDTMLTTLLHGLPSITIPGQHFERRYNALQMVQLGASHMLPVHAFRARRLAHVTREILQGNYAARSKELARSFSRFGGSEQAIDFLLAVAS